MILDPTVDESQSNTSFSKVITVQIDGEVSSEFNAVSVITSQFLSGNAWSNVYLMDTKIDSYSTSSSLVYDGITYGVSKADFLYDIPFEDEEFQLFFSEDWQPYYGYVDCSQFSDICGIIDYIKEITNWTTGQGTDDDEIRINDICTDYCDLTFCPMRNVIIEPICYDQPTDIIFVLDESGSIVNNGEFEDIKSIVKSTSSSLNCLSDSLRFAVACFSGTESFHIIQNFMEGDVDIDSYLPPPNQSTDVSDAYSKLLQNLENGSLTLKEGSRFQIILLTDGIYSSYLPYAPFNQIKNAPYYAENIVVYFEDLYPAMAQTAAAAIASKGGGYNGPIDQNTGDPEGAGGPRHLYVYESIDLDIAYSISSLANCNEVSITLEPYKDIASTDVMATNGGEVLSQSGTGTFLTNGVGIYSVGVRTEGPCEYLGIFEFESIDDCLPIPESEEGWEALLGYENQFSRHENFEQGRNDERSTIDAFDINIMPIPANDFLFVDIEDGKNSRNHRYNFQVYSAEGKLVERGQWKFSANKLSLDSYTEGLYTLRVQEEQGQSIVKKFVVIKF